MNLRTKELLGAPCGFNDFHNARSQSFNGGDMVGQDTHVTSFCGDVDLNDVFVGDNCLMQHVDAKQANRAVGYRPGAGERKKVLVCR